MVIKYPIAEKFKAPQGEGLFTGTPMAFIRLVGCSVGKGICTHCDTDFDKTYPVNGGGLFDADELKEWAGAYGHICITGGEPLDRELWPLIAVFQQQIHIETSGTKWVEWLADHRNFGIHVTVSPKPGYRDDVIQYADEIKVIIDGLGDGEGWPTIENAVTWAKEGKLVYLQPRNSKFDIDHHNLQEVIELCDQHPTLRVSAQLHKFLRTR